MELLRIIKVAARKTPGLGAQASRLIRRLKSRGFTSSREYWLDRYRKAGDSGPGSYGRLAQFKANFLNSFVATRGISKIVELGCGDGAQLELANYPTYTGLDISPEILAKCRVKFSDRQNYGFAHVSEIDRLEGHYDLALSLDVIFHLVEDEIYQQYMDELIGLSSRFLVIYSSNFEGHTVSKHVRHRRFTDYVSRNHPDWKLIQHETNPYPYDERDPHHTSFADFYVFEKMA